MTKSNTPKPTKAKSKANQPTIVYQLLEQEVPADERAEGEPTHEVAFEVVSVPKRRPKRLELHLNGLLDLETLNSDPTVLVFRASRFVDQLDMAAQSDDVEPIQQLHTMRKALEGMLGENLGNPDGVVAALDQDDMAILLSVVQDAFSSSAEDKTQALDDTSAADTTSSPSSSGMPTSHSSTVGALPE